MNVNQDLIKREREKQAWTQEHLASVTGLGLRTIQRIESSGVGSAEALALAAVFELPVEEIAISTSDETSADGERLRARVGSPYGELGLAAFYLAQLRFPYHTMRMAVTLAHAAFVNPDITVGAMDAIVEGWYRGRKSGNLNFEIWEDELDTPLEELRERHNIALAA